MPNNRMIIMREPLHEDGLFQRFRDICQIEDISVSLALREMMKGAIGKSENET